MMLLRDSHIAAEAAAKLLWQDRSLPLLAERVPTPLK